MNAKHVVAVVFAAVSCAAFTVTPLAGASHGKDHDDEPTGLVKAVRRATREFRDVAVAMAAGYAPNGGCVTGPQEGAMGLHFANGALVGDGVLDASRPEVLLYEPWEGKMRLLGVEFLVIAEAWHANNPGPPVLMGQHFHHVGSPNRYGLPPFYELHVWAWRDNRHGTFVDWNPSVSCDQYSGEGGS